MKQYLVPALLVAATYYFLALAGLSVAIPPGRSSIVWPAAGIAMGAVYVWGPRLLPGVWLGSFLANLWVVPHMGAATIPASGAVVEAWLGAWIMARTLRDPWLFVPSRVLIFFVICFASALLNGVWSPLMLGLEPIAVQMRTWVVGDAIGACLFAPLVVFLEQQAQEHDRLKLTIEELMEMRRDP